MSGFKAIPNQSASRFIEVGQTTFYSLSFLFQFHVRVRNFSRLQVWEPLHRRLTSRLEPEYQNIDGRTDDDVGLINLI